MRKQVETKPIYAIVTHSDETKTVHLSITVGGGAGGGGGERETQFPRDSVSIQTAGRNSVKRD